MKCTNLVTHSILSQCFVHGISASRMRTHLLDLASACIARKLIKKARLQDEIEECRKKCFECK